MRKYRCDLVLLLIALMVIIVGFLCICLRGGAVMEHNSAEMLKDEVNLIYQDDSVKRHAMHFLIDNISKKSSLEHLYLYQGDTIYPNDLGHYSNNKIFDILANSKVVTRRRFDYQSISMDYLMRNVELAYEVRRRYWWCAQLSDSIFDRYILPYRIADEPLDDWRSYYFEKYKNLADSIADCCESIDSVVHFFNALFAKRFIQAADKIPSCLSTYEINLFGGGTCYHMAVDAAHAMRALGLPINVDVIPWHGLVNGGHTYNSYISVDGNTVFFSPYERPKERNKWVAPIVLRSEFVIDGCKYIGEHYLNVTSEYYTVHRVWKSSVSQRANKLAVFNRGKFCYMPEDSVSDYFNCVSGVLYFPFDNDGMYAGNPFSLSDDGNVKMVQFCENDCVKLSSIPVTDGGRILKIEKGRCYKLMIWRDGKWIQVAKTISSDSNLLDFGDIKGSGVFIVVGPGWIGKMQRPFVLKDGIPFFM